jgi:hypothetical protein
MDTKTLVVGQEVPDIITNPDPAFSSSGSIS